MPGTSPHGNRLILTMKRLMGLLGVDHTVRLPIYGRVVSRSGAGCRREFRRSQALARAQARKNQHSLRPSTTNSIVECSDLNLPARPARLFGSSQSDPHSLRGCPAGVPCGRMESDDTHIGNPLLPRLRPARRDNGALQLTTSQLSDYRALREEPRTSSPR